MSLHNLSTNPLNGKPFGAISAAESSFVDQFEAARRRMLRAYEMWVRFSPASVFEQAQEIGSTSSAMQQIIKLEGGR